MKRHTLVAAAVAAALSTSAVVALRPASAPDPRAALPAVDRFAPGACRDAAGAVLGLARITRARDAGALTAADRAELRRWQDRLVTVRAGATGPVRPALTDAIVSLGHLRLRLDSRTAAPEHLVPAEQARSRLEQRCVNDR